METPIYDFLKEYSKKDPLRMHMPGHKGYAPENILDNNNLNALYSLDITEIHGADSLFEADGIIKKAKKMQQGSITLLKQYIHAAALRSAYRQCFV